MKFQTLLLIHLILSGTCFGQTFKEDYYAQKSTYWMQEITPEMRADVDPAFDSMQRVMTGMGILETTRKSAKKEAESQLLYFEELFKIFKLDLNVVTKFSHVFSAKTGPYPAPLIRQCFLLINERTYVFSYYTPDKEFGEESNDILAPARPLGIIKNILIKEDWKSLDRLISYSLDHIDNVAIKEQYEILIYDQKADQKVRTINLGDNAVYSLY